MYQPIRNHVFITADPERNLTKSLGIDKLTGKEIKIWIDPAFEPHATENVCQEGTVVAIPTHLDKEFGEMELEVGSYIYCHHFLTDKDQQVEPGMFRLLYEQIYAKRNGQSDPASGLVMIGPWNFLNIIEQKDERGLIPEHLRVNRSTNTGVAAYVSSRLADQVDPGDTVAYRKKMDYSIFVDGTEYLRVHSDDICGIILDGAETGTVDSVEKTRRFRTSSAV